MRHATLTLALAATLVLGCRSSESRPTAGAGAPQTRVPDSGKMDPAERRVPHPDEADRWQQKEMDRQGRLEGRRRAADERDRRIDEAPIEHPPDTPSAGEPPPK